MRITPLSSSAWLLSHLNVPAFLAAEALRSADLDGVVDVVAAYEDVAIYGSVIPRTRLAEIIASARSAAGATQHRIPVCYEIGLDTPEVAATLGLSLGEVAALHTGTIYQCAAVGFTPGFGYLEALPEELAGLPRLPRPRTAVPVGSVGITGHQTAVYPSPSPGGWRLIGQTPLTLVDMADDYFPLRAGDTVEFYAVSEDEFDILRGQRL